MMTVRLICIGKLKEKYLSDACKEYQKRLGAFCKLELLELPEYKLQNDPSESEITVCIRREGEEILAKIPRDALVIPMCIEGKQLSSEDALEVSSEVAAEELSSAGVRGISQVCFIIGGSYGLSDAVKAAGKLRLSMSKMTFPHQLARVMLFEQIYRAFSIASGGKYHK